VFSNSNNQSSIAKITAEFFKDIVGDSFNKRNPGYENNEYIAVQDLA
jgi:hypothetical protein